MVANDEGPRAKPGDDPREIEWPDDSKEMRAAERAKAAQQAAIRPAPRYLTAIAIGVGVVLAFLVPIALVMGNLGIMVFLSLPVVLVGVFMAFPIGALLERVSRKWRTGLPEMAFLSVGFTIGVGWTYAAVTGLHALAQSQGFPLEGLEEPNQVAFFRSVAGVFMGTATASAFMAAKFWTDQFRMFPKAVYSVVALIALLSVLSVLTMTVIPIPV